MSFYILLGGTVVAAVLIAAYGVYKCYQLYKFQKKEKAESSVKLSENNNEHLEK